MKDTERLPLSGDELFRALVETTDALTYVIDLSRPDGPAVYVSPQCETVLGYPPEELRDWRGRLLEILHPDDRERIEEAGRRTIEEGGLFDEEFRIRHRDGSERWLRDRAHVLPADDGRPAMWIGFSIDVTARRASQERARRTQHELTVSEDRHYALVQQLPAVVYVDSDEHPPRSIYMSPSAKEMLGYPPSAYDADPTLWPRSMHPDDRDRVMRSWARSVETGEPFYAEYRYVRPDGMQIWVRETSILIVDERTGARSWQGVILDVTREVLAEQEVRTSTARYRALVEGIPAVVYEMDPDDERRTVYVSPQIEELLGYTRQEWLDQPDIWIELLHPDDREHELAAHDRHNETGEPWRREYRLIAADGTVVWVRDQAVLVRGEDGRPLSWQGVIFDITAQKLAEERLRETNDELEFRVLARTSELADANELMTLEIGERRRAERELRSAEERYRKLVEELPAVIYIWQTHEQEGDPDHSYVSPQIEQLVGFTPAEWHARWHVWETRLHPHDRDRVLAATYHTASTGEPFQMEYRYLAKDGRIVWVLDRATLLSRDEQGRPFILQGVMLDITARKAAERKAAEAEARFEELAESSPVSTWAFEVSRDTDPPTVHIDYVGPRIVELLGYPVSRWIDDATAWFEMVHPDDREWLSAIIAEIIAAGTPWSEDFRMIAADGRVVWVRDQGRCVARDEHGLPVRFVGAMTDVTVGREAEQALRNEHAALLAVAEGIPAMPWTELVDPDTGWRRFTYLGPQVREFLGYEREELMAEPGHFERIVHPDDRERVLERSRHSDLTGEPWVDEFRVRRRDGEVRWLHAAARRVSTEGVTPELWHGVSVDITAIRDARGIDSAVGHPSLDHGAPA